MSITLNVSCKGQKPFKMTTYSKEAARSAMLRLSHGSKGECKIVADGALSGAYRRKRKAKKSRARRRR